MGEKTTIEIENLQILKQHALDTRKTLKQLINEAIEEKIQRERQSMGKKIFETVKSNQPIKPVLESVPKEKILEFKAFINEQGMTKVLEKELNKYFLSLNDISSEKITTSLIDDVRDAITMVFDEDTANDIAERLKELAGVQQ